MRAIRAERSRPPLGVERSVVELTDAVDVSPSVRARQSSGNACKEWTMAVISRDEIFDKVKEVLENALGVGTEEVTMDATLIGDLGAESIDFLDIGFKLEQEFSIKIDQGELFPENLMSDDSLVEDGKLTDKGMDLLESGCPTSTSRSSSRIDS